jgi:hypothetical protein
VQRSVSWEKCSQLNISSKELMRLNFLPRCGLLKSASWARASWRKCHKKAKNDCARFDSNLPSWGNAYKQISELSFGGISVQSKAGFRRTGAERLIRSESLA